MCYRKHVRDVKHFVCSQEDISDAFFVRTLILCWTLLGVPSDSRTTYSSNISDRRLVYESFVRRVENVFLIKIFLIYEGSSNIRFI